MADHGFTSTSAAARPAAEAAALVATLGLAAASWVVAVRQMHGMDMGVATRLGPFVSFIAAQEEPNQEPTQADFRRRPATPGDCQARSSPH